VATPADAQEVCGGLRDALADLYSGDLADGVRILYGGSVKADNAAGNSRADRYRRGPRWWRQQSTGAFTRISHAPPANPSALVFGDQPYVCG